MHGLTVNGVPHDAAARLAQLPPVAVLFASLLGYNPIQSLLGPQVLHHLPSAAQAHPTGQGSSRRQSRGRSPTGSEWHSASPSSPASSPPRRSGAPGWKV